jgi:superfamily II DNA or RNA helicase
MIGIELITKRQLPALILVHRQQLLDQWVDRIQTYLGIPKAHIGRFSGTKKKIGKEITIGLLQSFSRYKDIVELSDTFGTVIIDECHHIPAKTFREVIAHLNPQYLYGLTATPKRKHNDEQLIFVYIGDILATMDAVYQADSEDTVMKKKAPKIIIRVTDLEIPFQWKTDRFQLLAKIISFDTARNRLIASDIIALVKSGNKILVLSERKEHLEILALCLKGQGETILITGDDSATQRTSKLKQIHDGHYQIILSTGQFFGEGLHVEDISTLMLAFPFSFEGKLVQYIGRLMHSANPKFVFDYRDSKIPFLERQFKQRNRYYKKMNAT